MFAVRAEVSKHSSCNVDPSIPQGKRDGIISASARLSSERPWHVTLRQAQGEREKKRMRSVDGMCGLDEKHALAGGFNQPP